MQNFRIFTESKADVKFLKDYIEGTLGFPVTDEYFDTLGSWSGYKTGGVLKKSFIENQENDNISIVILDADNNIEDRRNEVLKDFTEFNTAIELFLFPNNSDNGELENLLAKIAKERKLIECFEGYEKCIEGYERPVNKSKIFAYLDALLPHNNKDNNKKDLIQEANRDYRNISHWDLNHEYLNPLKEFLSKFLK
jgi:hypothetical protein